MNSVYCTVNIVHITLYTVQSTVYSPFTLHCVQCELYSTSYRSVQPQGTEQPGIFAPVHSLLIVHCTVNIVKCTFHQGNLPIVATATDTAGFKWPVGKVGILLIF